MTNKTRALMLNGGKAVGTFFELGGANAVECLGLAGLDFIIIDTEHGPFDVESAADFIRAASLHGLTPFVRVKDATRASVLKMLDVGAEGLIVPCINTVDEVKALVEYAKYFPLGRRGVANGRGSGWGQADFAKGGLTNYFEICNREQLLIPQCETVGCLEHIEEIVAIDGVDGIFVGPYDLSTALGKPGQFDTDEFKAAVERVLAACKAAGKFATTFSGSAAAARAHFKQGFGAAAISMDAIHYINAHRALAEEARRED
ncbi:MAG: hypothetical protein IJF59_00710 [Clostridia bacterium]|nr:hypothetical protein [Clostridia bacterium]